MSDYVIKNACGEYVSSVGLDSFGMRVTFTEVKADAMRILHQEIALEAMEALSALYRDLKVTRLVPKKSKPKKAKKK